MNSLEILQLLAHLPNHTIGVYPSDKIPKKWTIPSALVFNTDNSKRPGIHWVSVYVDKNQCGCYFDSYGLAPFVPSHINRIRRNCKNLRWNTVQLQSESSTVCGHFCVMFLYYMSIGFGLEKFLEIFGKDCEKNDAIVEEFVCSFAEKNKNKNADSFIGNGGCCASRYLQSCSAKLSFL